MGPEDVALLLGARAYSPPYRSRLDDNFVYELNKYAHSSVVVHKEVEFHTRKGRLSLGLVLQRGDLRVGVECVPKHRHNPSRDIFDDLAILDTGKVKDVFRFHGKDIFHHTDDCIYFLSVTWPRLFSRRGICNLERLASYEAREYAEEHRHNIGGWIEYEKQINDTDSWTVVQIIRRRAFML